MWVLFVGAALVLAGCGTAGGGDTAAQDEPDAARTKTAPPTSAAPTTSTGPAAPDASRYVIGFGDLSAVSLPTGDPGVVGIVVAGETTDSGGAVNMVVRNNTSDEVGRIEVTGTARDSAGALVGSGSSQGFQPQVVAPGEIAYGYVYFDSEIPPGSTFQFSVDADSVDDYFLPVTVTEINNNGSQIIGAVTNENSVAVSGPISADVMCFGLDGSLIDYARSYAEEDELPAGGAGSFSIDLYGDECPIGLAAASGYGY